jgi:hypothetical protein
MVRPEVERMGIRRGILSLVAFWNLKYYYVAVFMPVALTSLFFRFFIESRIRANMVGRALIWCGAFVLPLLVISFLHPNFNNDRILSVIVSNNAAYNEVSDPGDYIRFNDVRATPLSILTNAPWAIF